MKAAPPKKPEPVSTVVKQDPAAAAADPNAPAPGADASADPNAPGAVASPIPMPLYPARRLPTRMPFLLSIRMPRSLRSIRTQFPLAQRRLPIPTPQHQPIRTPRRFLPIQMRFQHGDRGR